MWEDVKGHLAETLPKVKMGPVEDFTNFVNAVIDETSFNSLEKYINRAKESNEAEVVFGGGCDKSVGYFIEPTVILTSNPRYETMELELFGPVITIYVYENDKFDEALELCDTTSIYALTGAIFSKKRSMLDYMSDKLRHAAGNFYLNDKPTGAVVGQQPFGGGRASGTNDKAGSTINLLRWVSPQTIKETFDAPRDFMYPNFLED